MQLRYWKSANQSSDGMLKITSMCWSPDGKRLAVSTSERVVMMYDEDGVRRDKFNTKPSVDKGPKTYQVKQMSFSPSADRLAIAQTDNIVYVYKVGAEWGDKKSISNKFQHSSPVNCLVWPLQRPNDIVYGLAEGKVKIGQMKTHKPSTLYSSESYVTALTTNRSGNAVASAHLDGSIYTYFFDESDRGSTLIARHSVTPFALTWGLSIIVAGNDGVVNFYSEDGGVDNSFDLSDRPECKEFTCAATNPTGDSVVLGNFNSLYVYSHNAIGWEEMSVARVDNMYSVASMDWKPDGGKLAIGTLCGVVDLYDICLKRMLHKGKFEITHVSGSQVIVKNVETNVQLVVRSRGGLEIMKTTVYSERYVISTTIDTIIAGDMLTSRISEVKFRTSGKEKYIFDNEAVCAVYVAGEMSIIEYGTNDFLAYFRTSFVNKHVFSVRVVEQGKLNRTGNESNSRFVTVTNTPPNKMLKRVAYLIDQQTICVKDLQAQTSNPVINHDRRVDWLMLNENATMLLFRDGGLGLHLYTIATQTRIQLINACSYVQWVPFSDVIVAQNRSNLCVWYNVATPDQVTTKPIKGDIEEIERGGGKTVVLVDEGLGLAEYPLDEALISFSSAIEDGNLNQAMSIIDKLEVTCDVKEMWKQLYNCAIANDDLTVAVRSSSVLGDAATANYLTSLQETMTVLLRESGSEMALRDHYFFRAKMALLRKDLAAAEAEFLGEGKIDECIKMYQNLMKHDLAIRVAEHARHPDVEIMKQNYYEYLLETKQYELAAQLSEKANDHLKAIELYMKGNMPAKAARVVLTKKIYQPMTLLESILAALTRSNLYDVAGEFYEYLDDFVHAIDSYERGNTYRKAVELARKCFPGRVVELQEKWGDYLVSQRQIDMAINHYIEAKSYQKAIEAALSASQYPRALQLVKAIDESVAKPYFITLARHYEETAQYDLAERCYLASGDHTSAVNMHASLGNWEVANKIASAYMSSGEMGLLYINHAQSMEEQNRLKDAEKLYLAVKEVDMAINMYKKLKRYGDMIRLVKDHRPDLLKETHQYLAHALEVEGSLRDAEGHYVEALEWQSAVNMYRSNELWDDSIRVAKTHGGIHACKRMSLAILIALGVVEGSKYIIRHGLVEASIDHAGETGAFDIAFEVAKLNLPSKIPDIHLKHALFLEDNEKYAEAEAEFVGAGKPREAIDMYMHIEDWTNALRVADSYDPPSVPDIHVQHAKLLGEAKQHTQAEEYFLVAARPELALEMYKEAGLLPEALRIAHSHLPHLVPDISAAMQSSQYKGKKPAVGGKSSDIIALGKTYEQAKRWAEAVELYMTNPDNDVNLYERAVDLARSNMPNRAMEIAVEASKRLVQCRREDSAAGILFEMGRFDEAIELCLNAKKFDKAMSLASGNATLSRRVDEAYQSYLTMKQDAGKLYETGKVDVALDVLAKKGDWDQLWEIVGRDSISISTVVVGKFVLMRINELLATDKFEGVAEAVRLLHKRLVPATENIISTMKNLTRRTLACQLEDQNSSYMPIIKLLRESLYCLTNQFRSETADGEIAKSNLYELLMSTHYHYMMHLSLSFGLKDVAARSSISLLKYPFVVPQDKLFYQAGMLCREVKDNNLAFMLLNRYVDITEAIDCGNTDMMDDSEYLVADAIPLNGPLPTRHFVRDEETREEVRTWVLSVVTDSAVEQRFPSRDHIRSTLSEGVFSTTRKACIVTGFPVHPADMLEVNNSTANRRDWNALVAKTRLCPWTSQQQNPIY